MRNRKDKNERIVVVKTTREKVSRGGYRSAGIKKEVKKVRTYY